MKTKNLIESELFNDIKKIMTLDNNKTDYNNFRNMINNLQPKSCIVKVGWISGKEINFTIAYKKKGTNEPFELFIKNIENKAEVHGFINGLNPVIFHFNPEFVLNDNENLVINFKLS